MEAITASLEKSLQNCSLNHHRQNGTREDEGSATTTDAPPPPNSDDNHISDTTLELNSHISLPYHWEQCLDLKTGEIYYLNWRNGMKAKKDPRERDCEQESEEEESWYEDDSEEESSSSECSTTNEREIKEKENDVLVVAGCKICLMYFMVPKQVEDCPKCNGQLLHFDRSQNCSP